MFTGCDATYNINIDDKIEEVTNFYFEESDYNYDTYYVDYGDDNLSNYSNIDEFVDSIFNKDYLAFDQNFNDQELYNAQRNNDGISLNYTYKYDDFDKSSILNYCGDIVDYNNIGGLVKIDVDDFSNCFMSDYGPHLNNLTVNIKTDLKVTDNNADKVKGNTYTWTFDSNDFYDKSIKIVMQKNNRSKKMNFLNGSNMVIFIFFLLFVIFLGFMIYIFVRKRHISNNSF